MARWSRDIIFQASGPNCRLPEKPFCIIRAAVFTSNSQASPASGSRSPRKQPPTKRGSSHLPRCGRWHQAAVSPKRRKRGSFWPMTPAIQPWESRPWFKKFDEIDISRLQSYQTSRKTPLCSDTLWYLHWNSIWRSHSLTHGTRHL